jgi:hypothetical protein
MADQPDSTKTLGHFDFWGDQHVDPLDLAQDPEGHRSLQELREFMEKRAPKREEGQRVKGVRVVAKNRTQTAS